MQVCKPQIKDMGRSDEILLFRTTGIKYSSCNIYVLLVRFQIINCLYGINTSGQHATLWP